MKQVEITLKVNNNFDEIDDILTNKGFEVIKKNRIEDIYLSQYVDELKEDNIPFILEKSVLIRRLIINDRDINSIMYKDKKYENGDQVYEEKISVDIDDIEKAKKIFFKLGFKKLVEVNYDYSVYSDGEREIVFQDVEGLGMMLEYESNEDFEGKPIESINEEKDRLIKDIKSLGLSIEDNTDIRKAIELIKKSLMKKSEEKYE